MEQRVISILAFPTYIDEECGKDQHGGEVHGDDGFKEEGFEVVGGVADHVEENSGDKCSENDCEKPPTQEDINF